MHKLLLITALTLCSSTLLVASATADIDFQNKVQKLEAVVNTPWWNPITCTLNTTYRLPTKAAYQERLALAEKVHEITGKSQLSQKVRGIGYQDSWLKKRPSLNLAIAVICYSSPVTVIEACFLLLPEEIKADIAEDIPAEAIKALQPLFLKYSIISFLRSARERNSTLIAAVTTVVSAAYKKS